MTDPDPLLGATIGGIRLDEKLGTGGMGAVYLGVQTSMSRRVAVKILSQHLSSNAEYISRFRREAVTAGKLEHPNIVSVFDIGHEGGLYYIVMEYVEGQPLQRIIDAVGAVAPRDAARLVAGVLRGLHHAHEMGIVHRDVKPGNVIVTKENEPKILDFGLAIAIDPRDKLTGTGSVLGTPLYLSPEQAQGRAAEPRSDIYAAGVMFYALLTGRVPFSGQDPLAVLNMHLHDTPVSPTNLNPRIPQALNDIALKMLAKRPEDRHATAELAARDLQTFLDGKLLALPPRPAPRVVRRRAAPVGLIVGVIMGIAFLFLVMKTKAPPDESAAPPPVSRPPPGPDPDLAEAREKADAILAVASRDGPRDYAIYPDSVHQMTKLAGRYANRRDIGAVIEAARKNLVADAERHAREHESQVRRKIANASGDVYQMREIYREFPKPFLEITETGRAIAKAIRDNEERVATRIQADFESIPRLCDADEFDHARAKLNRLGDVVPVELREKVGQLRDQAVAAEAERRLQLIPQLVAQIVEIEKHAASLLERRQSDEAWNAILGFVETHPPTKLAATLVRISTIPHATLRSIVPSTVTEEEIDSHLGRFETEATGDEAPSHRVRWLLEDVLRREWLRRRADRGIKRLAGTEVTLRSFGGIKGKLTAGSPPSVDPGNGPAQSIIVDQLEARDQIYFAAAAAVEDDDPVATVFKSSEHKRFALAAAAVQRYTPAPDRFSEALRWMEQAKILGMRVPPPRIAALEEAARQERNQIARDLLGRAIDHAAGGRFEKAHEELDRAVKDHEDRSYFPLLDSVGRDLRGRFWLSEAEDDAKNSRWAKALAVMRRLRTASPGFQPERATPLFHKALLNAGAWASWPMGAVNASSKIWTWEGKTTGTRPSARLEAGQILLTDVGGFRPLYLERPRTSGATGIRARIRVNQTQQTFEAGFQFDVKEPAQDLRRLLVRSTNRLEAGSRREGRWAVDDDEEVKPPVALKEWYEIAIVSDGTETVFYFGPAGAPLGVITLPGALDPKAGFGLWANVDTTFADIQVRDARP
ncbi:MAG TPA: protein kinase [Planctomycetota bacterium]|nr:protein kinase [Planctomycetota bacterium]